MSLVDVKKIKDVDYLKRKFKGRRFQGRECVETKRGSGLLCHQPYICRGYI